jgi:twitching motility protein PilI
MAHKESLKDMQARLAERLKHAQSSGVSAAWLAVAAGGEKYLLPLRQSGELVPVSQWQAVPHTKPWFLGVMNIRGSLFGAIDLAQFIAYAASESQHATQDTVHDDGHHAHGGAALNDGTASIVTISPAIEGNCAVQVNALMGLRGSDAFASSTSARADAPPFFGDQFFDAQGERWQEINLQALSQSPQFLNISA